ncbi:MAG: co-chaperone GroES [Patescibacteria group bacterium]
MAKKLSLKPLGDRVVVKPSENGGERKLASGLIIPDTVDKEKLLSGTVMATGPGRLSDTGERLMMEVAVGDVVVFKKPWDEPIKLDGVEYYVLHESDISLIQLS